MIRYELWTVGNAVSTSAGWGNSFDCAFASDLAGRNCYVKFFLDANGNSQCDVNEVALESNRFLVLEKRVFDIWVDVSEGIPDYETFGNIANIRSIFEKATNIVLNKNSATDYRAAVEFRVAARTFFTPSDTRPDPVDYDTNMDLHYDAPADVVIVNNLINGGEPLGVNDRYDWHRTIISYDRNVNALHGFTPGQTHLKTQCFMRFSELQATKTYGQAN